MPGTLAILEVSQKQAYIFSSKYLKVNQDRSETIRFVTENLWKECLSPGLSKAEQEKRLVYAGGGHVILQFETRDEARETVKKITRRAYCDFGHMDVFAKLMDYDPNPSREPGISVPAANLKELVKQLEVKKSLRSSAFRRRGTGLEQLDPVTFQPKEEGETRLFWEPQNKLDPEKDLERAHQTAFDQIAGNDNFIAVVHIDGNNMGAKSQKVTEDAGEDWDECCREHRRFSESVDQAFTIARRRTFKMVEALQNAHKLDELGYKDEHIFHPIEPVVSAGDDICFVTAGKLGIECAVFFLRALQNPNAPEFQKLLPTQGLEPYSACAGVAIVHTKYPFHRAYELSEELCSSAKRYAAELGEKNKNDKDRISTIDWHIEFGQGRGSIAESREDYLTEDSGDGSESMMPRNQLSKAYAEAAALIQTGNYYFVWDKPDEKQNDKQDDNQARSNDSNNPETVCVINPIRTLTLRPYAVIGGEASFFRCYSFFRSLFRQINSNLSSSDENQGARYGQLIPRSKLKGFRAPLKQGLLETELYVRMNRLEELEKWAHDEEDGYHSGKRTRGSFASPKKEFDNRWYQRCLYFDAVEMVDHLYLLDDEEL